MSKLDFGGGYATTPGFQCVDIVDTADYQINLDKPDLKLPFAEDIIEEAVAHHFIEHINNIIPFMDEVFRILKEGALFRISTPYAGTQEWYQDPTHKRAYVERSFEYFRQDSPFKKEQREYGIKSRFIIEENKKEDWQLLVVLRKPETQGTIATFT
jgi:hypothetical protein